ncbi:ribose-phosphate diphosphokinase [Bradymonadaceae bacterium TMQ3]|uniref:ribose-phosphate diphosphokinase n=1 Tax=Lujinxingia sediminis TaxID=2480984 RepID=A0ABY0CWI5_9DELT|nr:ribose-phosphate diphosphokinase [Lujinxingia sediminis]RDV39708.1 ribose-phosphate diphosphokinase [Bradymonadaceae bacterium TMQ3]RVU48247.1 ribose-phosphate diphosphokinase [Lujinxingia sediminis]TXC77547.1 ribose-phosphate diphosphokinase [Bradymonadales bacterium TMQ1]
MNKQLKVFSGGSHPEFCKSICRHLGIELGKSTTVRFSNENMMVQIEENVRECDVFVVQTSASPVHENLFELLIMIDALRSASASRITAVMPYIPYIRSDKKDRPRISITARLVADLLKTAGADRVLTMDLHSAQAQGFFRMPVDQLLGAGPICDRLRQEEGRENWVLVAADAGEAKDLGRYANRLDLPMAIIDKRRDGDDERPRAVSLIGDVKDKVAVIVDDEIASGGTLIEAATFLKEKGADKVLATATHPIFSSNAAERIDGAFIDKVFVTDTVPLRANQQSEKVEVISVAKDFAEAISRIHDGRSVSELFHAKKPMKQG